MRVFGKTHYSDFDCSNSVKLPTILEKILYKKYQYTSVLIIDSVWSLSRVTVGHKPSNGGGLRVLLTTRPYNSKYR